MGDSNEELIIVLCTFSVMNCYLTDGGFCFRVDRLNEMPIPVFKLVHETKGSTDILYEFEIFPAACLEKMHAGAMGVTFHLL